MAPCYAPRATLATMTTNDLSTDLDRIADLRATYAGLAPRAIAGEPWALAERLRHWTRGVMGSPRGPGPSSSRCSRSGSARWSASWPGDGREPVPFGRIADDANRLGMIERDRTLPLAVLFQRVDAGLVALGRPTRRP